MHDLIFAVAFIAMIAAPAMVATVGGRKEYNPSPAPKRTTRPRASRPAVPAAPSQAASGSVIHPPRFIPDSMAPTLPMHGRGMSNR